MRINETKTVAEYVNENIKTAHIFKKYGIDFCCGGGISLIDAIENAGLDFRSVSAELEMVDIEVAVENNYKSWSLAFLADHISNIHHKYIEESIPIIIQYAARVVQVHAEYYPELIQVQRIFSQAVVELGGHTMKEENILFPFIREMVNIARIGGSLDKPSFETVDNPIRVMKADHDEVGGMFRQISALTNNYMPPAGACNTFKAFYAKLQEFEEDLHQHVHLENNILFPGAVKLEKQLLKA